MKQPACIVFVDGDAYNVQLDGGLAAEDLARIAASVAAAAASRGADRKLMAHLVDAIQCSAGSCMAAPVVLSGGTDA